MQIAHQLVKLYFTTPLHIGNERSDYVSSNFIMHSDAFMAAIFHAWSRLGYGKHIPDSPEKLPGFVISSLFPFVNAPGNSKSYYFLPKPRWGYKIDDDFKDGQEKQPGQNQYDIYRKQLKKAVYVDWYLFPKILQESKLSSVNLSNRLGSYFWIGDDGVPLETLQNIVRSQIVPRATVSRSGTEDTVIYYVERHYFQPNQSGLYFLIYYEDEDKQLRERIEKAIYFLGQEGIGTDRNVGNGKFKPEFCEPPEMQIDDSRQGYAVNLGLYHPSSFGELQHMLHDNRTTSQISYELIRRSGWLSEPYQTWRKRAVYMFSEGSVFKRLSDSDNKVITMGSNVDVKPQHVHPPIPHPVWRFGRTIFIPF